MKYLFFLIVVLFTLHTASCKAQSPRGLEQFNDIKSITPDIQKWNNQTGDIVLSAFGFSTRIPYNKMPLNNKEAITLAGWRGEEINYQLVISSKKNIDGIKANSTDLISNEGEKIAASNIKTGFVYFVLADNSRGTCHKKNIKYEDLIVPDIVDFKNSSSFVKPKTNRPIWIKLKIPEVTSPGTYNGKIAVTLDGKTLYKDISVTVSKNSFKSSDESFFLDLWQYPIVEADYYKVKPWSAKHFELMKPAMQRLADAGQKVITTSFFWDVFNPAVRSEKEMMIEVIKTRENKWKYDFTNFDNWVNFMMKLGIKKQITCFGIAPLNYRYYYYDENSGKVAYFSQGVNGADYLKFWTSYLSAFEAHLKEKSWFDITAIGIDEKEIDVLTPLVAFIKKQNKDWKISFTGKFFPQLQDNIYNYSVISNQLIPPDLLTKRQQKGYITTYYTSCWEIFPNTFVMSDPIDATWLCWNAANRGLNGYLRFAYDYWDRNILLDTRTNQASGDKFLIYPNGYSSVRFEMLKQGIEDYRKIMIKAGAKSNIQVQNLLKVNNGVSPSINKIQPELFSKLQGFDFKKVNAKSSRELQIQAARKLLNN